jgi:hypothetical protein
VSLLDRPTALAVGYLVVLTAVVGATVGQPCQGDLAATAPAESFEIQHEDDRLVVTRTGGRIPADDTRSLELVVRAPDGDGPGSTYSLVGPNDPAIKDGDRFTVENATVAGRPLRDGDVVRIVWRGYDLDGRPFFCPAPEERSRVSATMAKWVVGDA